MLAYLKGIINYKTGNYLVLNLGNAGYKIYSIPTLLAEVRAGEELALYLHQHVRENAIDLYGFKTREDLEVFENLISVSGLGPKSALKTMTVASSNEIMGAIQTGNPAELSKFSGIGPKLAEKIIMDLKGKIELKEGEAISLEDSEVIDALVGLGYKIKQAREVVKKIPSEISGSSNRIREALKLQGK